MSTFKQITDLIETAIFHYQSRDVSEVINFIRANSTLRSLDEKEIERLINIVCTSYKETPDSYFYPNA
jgi:predicted RNA-binding protein with PIN domain